MIHLHKNALVVAKTLACVDFFAARPCYGSAVVPFTELPLSRNRNARSVLKNRPTSGGSQFSDPLAEEAEVLSLARAGQHTEALDLTAKLYENGRRLSSKGATILTSVLSRAGRVDGVLKVSNFVRKNDPLLWSRQSGYGHYYAEALYRSGDIEGSVRKFEELYLRHQQHRDKINNLLSFLAIYLSNNNAEAGIELLTESCVRLARCGYFQPLVNVWRCLFTSENGRHHVAARSLLKEGFDVRSFVEKKVVGILSVAAERDDIDMVQRLLEVVLHLHVESRYAEVFSALLEFYCNRNDLDNALATFEHSRGRGISLRPATIYRYTCFLGSRGVRIPGDVLSLKYQRSTDGIKYRF